MLVVLSVSELHQFRNPTFRYLYKIIDCCKSERLFVSDSIIF